MAEERTTYPDSSRRSEQLSCTKFFYPSYSLFYINFKRFKSFLDLFNYFNSTLSRTVFADGSMASAVNRGVDWVADVWVPLVIDCLVSSLIRQS